MLWVLLEDKANSKGIAAEISLPGKYSIATYTTDKIDVDIKPDERSEDDITRSAILGAQQGYQLLSCEGYSRCATAITFNLQNIPCNINGYSSSLLFAIATITHLYPKNYPPIAATGCLDEDGRVHLSEDDNSRDGIPEKVREALTVIPNERDGIIFYPKSKDKFIDQSLRDLAEEKKVKLCPIERLDEAAKSLGIEINKVYLDTPYLGLAAFESKHSSIYFGRQLGISKLREKLLDREKANVPGILIISASGTGKSSLVQAGLIPALQKGSLSLQDRPVISAIWRPSDATDAGDESQLTQSIATNWESQVEFRDLLTSVATLTALSQALSNGFLQGRRFVWVVDQMEELFTIGMSSELIGLFCQFLHDLQKVGVWVIGTLRNDFFSRYQAQSKLVETFGSEKEGLVLLEPMDETIVRQVIEGPAKLARLAFECDDNNVSLVDRLLTDMRGHTDALPLLEFFLTELYNRRNNRILTYRSYKEMGCLNGAIGQCAMDAFFSLNTKAQETLPRLLWLLTSKVNSDDREQIVATPFYLQEHDTPLCELVDKFVEQRLLVRDVPPGGLPKIRVSHEALLTHWPKAKEIIDDFAADKALFLQLQELAKEWGAKQGNDLLDIPGSKLLGAQELLEKKSTFFNPNDDVWTFVRAGINRRDAEEARNKQRTRRWLNAITILAIVSFVFAVVAWNKMQEAKTQATRSLSGKFVGQSILAATQPSPKNGYIDHAILLAVQAYKLAPDNLEAQENLLTTIQKTSHFAKYYRNKKYINKIKSIAFTFNPNKFVSVDEDGTVLSWDDWSDRIVPTPGQLWRTHAGSIIGVNACSLYGIVNLSHGNCPFKGLSPYDKANTEPFEQQPWDSNSSVTSIAFSASAGKIISGDKYGSLVLWDVASGKPIGQPWSGQHQGGIGSVAFSADGKQVISGSENVRILVLWDVASGKPIWQLSTKQQQGKITSVYLDGKQIISGDEYGSLVLWDVASGKLIKKRSWQISTGAITSIDYKGTKVVTGSADGTLSLFSGDVDGDIPHRVAKISTAITSVAFSPFGQSIIIAGEDGSLVSWDMDTAEYYSPSSRIWKMNPIDIFSGELKVSSPDEKLLLASSGDGYMVLKDLKNQNETIRSFGNNSQPWWQNPMAVYNLTSAAFSADSKQIVSGSKNGILTLWDVASGKPIGPGQAHKNVRLKKLFFP